MEDHRVGTGYLTTSLLGLVTVGTPTLWDTVKRISEGDPDLKTFPRSFPSVGEPLKRRWDGYRSVKKMFLLGVRDE